MADRYLYLPSAGLLLLLALGIEAAVRRVALRRVLTGALVFYFGTLTVCRNPVWRTSVALWRDNVRHYPEDVAALRQYASSCLMAARAARRRSPAEANALLDEAMLRLGQARRRAPGDPKVLLVLSHVHQEAGRLPAAERVARQAIRLDPNAFDGYYRLGTIREAQSRWKEAAAWYRKAVLRETAARKRGVRKAGYNLANVLVRLGREREAEAEFRRVIEVHPGYAEAQNNLAELLARTGRLPEAVDLQRRAVALAPRRAAFHHHLGHLLERSGDIEGAYASLRRALALDPSAAGIRAALASICDRTGRAEEARALRGGRAR
jgi:tetratricopeptide (TPR) repeat protein